MGWLAWVHRPYEDPDWYALFAELEEKEDCQNRKLLLNALKSAGHPAGSWLQARLEAGATCSPYEQASLEVVRIHLESAADAQDNLHLWEQVRDHMFPLNWPLVASDTWEKVNRTFDGLAAVELSFRLYWLTLRCYDDGVWELGVKHSLIEDAMTKISGIEHPSAIRRKQQKNICRQICLDTKSRMDHFSNSQAATVFAESVAQSCDIFKIGGESRVRQQAD